MSIFCEVFPSKLPDVDQPLFHRKSSEADTKKRKIEEVSSDKTDAVEDNPEPPVKKQKTEPPAPAPKPKLAPNVFEEKEAENSGGKTKRGPVQGSTLDFLQQIKHDASSGAIISPQINEIDEEEHGSKKKKDSKKLEPEISYEEWKPPEGTNMVINYYFSHNQSC